MKPLHVFVTLIVSSIVLLGCHLALAAGEKQERPYVLPGDAAAAWAELQKLHQALRPPKEWRTRMPNADDVASFQKQVRRNAASFAGKAREFIERFPKNGKLQDARIILVNALNHAVAAGDANAEKQLAAFVDAVLADKSIAEDNRVWVLLFSGNSAFMKKVGMRFYIEGMSKLREEFDAATLKSGRAALKQFPKNSLIYTMLLSIAQRSKGERKKKLAAEILNAPGALPGAKALAEHILNGTRPYEIGRPLDIRFTALDGRKVDITKLKGKVVLVEFWSTTCGPCIAALPALKAAYKKYHLHGFEVVAISLDFEEAAVRRFIKDKGLLWPQHFDGKGWGNKFAVRYGIFSIPTAWLVDKRGNLRDIDAHFQLERRIKALLVEPASPGTQSCK